MLDKAATMQTYAERLKAGIEVERPIALGVLKIKAKLGELMPAQSGGRGKKNPHSACDSFHANTVTQFRKLARNRARLEEYYETIDDVPTQTDFLRFCKPTPEEWRNGNSVPVEEPCTVADLDELEDQSETGTACGRR